MKKTIIFGGVVVSLLLVLFLLLKNYNFKLFRTNQSEIDSLKSSQQNNQSDIQNLKDQFNQEMVDLQSKIDKFTPIETFYTTNNTYPTNNYITQGTSGSTGTYVNLQAATPGVPQTGSFNVTGIGIAGTLQGTTLTDGTATITGGAIAGATTIAASGVIQGGSLTDGTATITGGNITGVGTLTATNINGFTLQGAIVGNTQNATGFTQVGATTGAFTNINAFTLQGAIAGNAQNITGVGTFGASASTVTSLDVSSGGITNTGAVSGVTTLTTSGKITTPNINKQLIVDGTTYAATGAGIQAALNALPAQGGEVYIPEGTYNLSAVLTIPQNNVTLRGAGRGTILFLSDGANSNVISATTKSGLTIKDLYINGNDAGNTGTCHGIYFTGVSYSLIDNVTVYDTEDRGIDFGATLSKITNSTLNSNYIGIFIGDVKNVISNNNVYQNGNYGISVGASSNVVVSNNIANNTSDGINISAHFDAITGNSISENSGNGISIQGTSVTISGNFIYYNSTYGIYITTATSKALITGNSIQQSYKHGIYINGVSSNTITGNLIKDNDRATTATYDGIFLDGDSDFNVISSNRLQDNDRYEINISAATCNENYLTGNDTTGTGHVGEINDAGTDTKYSQDNKIQTEEATILLNPDGANAGEVVIGSATDQDSLRVYGTAFYEGVVNTWTNFDYAESFPITGEAEAGDMMVIDPDNDYKIMRSTGEQGTVVGIISTSPGFLAGSGEGYQPLALEGVVPGKVDATYGAIHRGDLLALSKTPGYARKANSEDASIVGIALENFETGQGLIKVMVKVQNRPMTVSEALQGASNQDILTSESNVGLDQLTDSTQISPNQEQILGSQTDGLNTQSLSTSKLAASLQGGESSDWFADQDLKVKSLEITGDLKVSGTTTLATLEILDSAVFKGEVRILSLATFEGELIVKKAVSFEGDVKILGILELGENSKGEAKILAGSQSVKVSFGVSYQKIPVVNITPLVNPESYFWVSEITKLGFVINLSEPAKNDIIFNWMVVQ